MVCRVVAINTFKGVEVWVFTLVLGILCISRFLQQERNHLKVQPGIPSNMPCWSAMRRSSQTESGILRTEVKARRDITHLGASVERNDHTGPAASFSFRLILTALSDNN